MEEQVEISLTREELRLVCAALEEHIDVWLARANGGIADECFRLDAEAGKRVLAKLEVELETKPLGYAVQSGVVDIKHAVPHYANQDVNMHNRPIGIALENSKPLNDGSGLHSVRVRLNDGLPPELIEPEAAFVHRARRIGALVDEKNKAYGDSFARSDIILNALYPDGIAPSQYRDALGVVRVVDKLFRIATKKDAFGESPWDDVAGYGIVAGGKEQPK